MRPESDLHQYQLRGIHHIIQHPDSMLWLDMGLGKTITALTALDFLIRIGQVNKVLVVAPLRVCETVWRQEALGWDHTHHLKFSYLLGNEKKRLRGLFAKADFYLINYENLEWLSGVLQHYFKEDTWPFQAIVWDEVSKMKHSTSNRGKAMRPLLPLFQYRIGLTGTPASNGLKDLHGQFLVIDGGKRLTEYITHYKDRYFFQEAYSHQYIPYSGAKEKIHSLISDITLQMKAADYLELPDFRVNDIWINMNESLTKKYRKLEREMFIELDHQQVAVFNASALSTKCRQFANGAIYHEADTSKHTEVHDLKIQAVREIQEESGDSSILLAYAFRSDVARLQRAFPNTPNLSGMAGRELTDTIDAWNRGEIRLLLGHPASMGHGLNLQTGGFTLIWYGLNWALDLYEQFNARLYRQGQRNHIVCHRILLHGTVEQAMINALESKAETQAELRDAINNYRNSQCIN